MDFFMVKNCTTSAPDTRKATIHVPVKSYFFPQITFWRYKAI